MKDPLNDWQELQSDWQSFEPDIQKIKKKVNWVTWRMTAVLVIDVLAIIAYIPFVYYLYISNKSHWVINSWHYLLGVLLIYGVYLDFKIRIPIFKLQGETTKDILELYLKRTKAGVSIGRLGKNFSWVLLVSFVIWVGASNLVVPDVEKLSDWRFVAFGTIYIGVFILLCGWYQNKKHKEYLKLKKLWQEYLL